MKKEEKLLFLMEHISDEHLLPSADQIRKENLKKYTQRGVIRRDSKRRNFWPWAIPAACFCFLLFALTPMGKSLAAAAKEEVKSLLEQLFPPKEMGVILEGMEESAFYTPHTEKEMEEDPKFVIYVDDALYETYEEKDVLVIRPKGMEEKSTLPECSVTISHLQGISMEEAVRQIQTELEESYAETTKPKDSSLIEGMYLRAGNGTAWDAAQTEVHLAEDGEEGVFVIRAVYFTEAAEGHGARFAAMIRTFEVVKDR